MDTELAHILQNSMRMSQMIKKEKDFKNGTIFGSRCDIMRKLSRKIPQ